MKLVLVFNIFNGVEHVCLKNNTNTHNGWCKFQNLNSIQPKNINFKHDSEDNFTPFCLINDEIPYNQTKCFGLFFF